TTGDTMSDQVRDLFEIPKEMRSMAEAGFEQTRSAFEKFLAGAEATAGSLEERGATMRAGARDIGAKAIANAENMTEVLRLHGEYVQTQMRSFAEQASEMGQTLGKAAMEAAKPKA